MSVTYTLLHYSDHLILVFLISNKVYKVYCFKYENHQRKLLVYFLHCSEAVCCYIITFKLY